MIRTCLVLLNEISIASNLTVAIAGALLGSLLTWQFNRNREKVTLTLDLHKEYNTYEMNLHRKKADALLEEYPELSYDQLENLKHENIESVFVVLFFFQRLSLCVEQKQIKETIIQELFVEPFYFWYYISYQKNLVPLKKWNAANHMLSLSNWFKSSTSFEKHYNLKEEMEKKLLGRIQKK